MSDGRLQRLVDRIPERWGKWIRFNEGWDEIVIDLDRYLARLFPNYEIHQMKEKFGVLRFYWDPGEEKPENEQDEYRADSYSNRKRSADALVGAAEVKSSMTCEECDADGKLHATVSGWHKTLCPHCAEARVKMLLARSLRSSAR